MRRARPLVFLAIAGVAACTTFEAEPAAPTADGGTTAEDASPPSPVPDASAPEVAPLACTIPACAANQPSCRFVDFTTGCTASGITFTGDTIGQNGVEGGCDGGRLHVAASKGMGVNGVLEVMTPAAVGVIRVSARLTLTRWDRGRILLLKVQGSEIARISAVGQSSGNPAFVLCGADGACRPDVVDAGVGREHVVTLAISPSSTVMSVDCVAVSTLSVPAKIAPSAPLEVTFGKDGTGDFDGTLDDLLITYQ